MIQRWELSGENRRGGKRVMREEWRDCCNWSVKKLKVKGWLYSRWEMVYKTKST